MLAYGLGLENGHFADIQYCLYADIVGVGPKTSADVIYGWSLSMHTYVLTSGCPMLFKIASWFKGFCEVY